MTPCLSELESLHRAWSECKPCPVCGVGEVVDDNEEAKGRELHLICLGCHVEVIDPEWRDVGDEWELQYDEVQP